MKKTKKEPHQQTWLTEQRLRFYPLLLGLLALAAVFVLIIARESDMLLRVQELNLFLYTPLFFKQQLVVAGGFLTWLGTYFTQYFYHPWLGTLLLCLWLGLLMWLVKHTFAISAKWAPLLLLPVALVLLTDFDLGYWIYYLKLRGQFFIAVIGFSLAVALTWAFRRLAVSEGRLGLWLPPLFILLSGVLMYPVAGFYGLLALLLMGIIVWRLDVSVGRKALTSVVALATLAVVPMVYYRQVFCQASFDNIWWQALPVFITTDKCPQYYYPYAALVLVLVAMSACYRMAFTPSVLKKQWGWLASQVVLTAAIVWGCWHFWYKDETFHEEIRMTQCVDNYDWQGVVDIMSRHEGVPTRMMVMYKNLALFKLGRAGDEMYNYRDGSKAPDCPFELRVAQIGGKNIYLHYGLLNYSYRWCLEDGVELGWRVEHLKFLVRCSLLNKEWKTCQKFIDLLKQTKYHAQWAEHYEQLMTPEGQKSITKDPELGPIFHLMGGLDLLASDQSLIELFLLNTLAYHETSDPVCSELVLLSAMQLKDIPAFWQAFFQYAKLHVGQHMPRHFQEAAYLYGHLEKTIDISGMPFDDAVRKSHDGFMQMAVRCQKMTNEQMMDAFYPQYGNTFYYNYFLMRKLKSY